MSHDRGWRAACGMTNWIPWFHFEILNKARGVTPMVVGSGALFGLSGFGESDTTDIMSGAVGIAVDDIILSRWRRRNIGAGNAGMLSIRQCGVNRNLDGAAADLALDLPWNDTRISSELSSGSGNRKVNAASIRRRNAKRNLSEVGERPRFAKAVSQHAGASAESKTQRCQYG